VYTEFSPEQQARVASQLKAFLSAEGEENEHNAVPIESVGHMRELLRQCKILIKVAAVETEERLRSVFTLTPKQLGPVAHPPTLSLPGGDSCSSSEGMGALERGLSGAGLGLAAASDRPPATIASPFSGGGGVASSGGLSYGGGGFSPATTSGLNSLQSLTGFTPDVNAAWRMFKVTPGLGSEGASRVHASKAALATAKASLSAAAKEVNERKAKVDAALANLEVVRARGGAPAGAAGGRSPSPPNLHPPAPGSSSSRSASPAVVEEEFAAAAALTAAKAEYRRCYEVWSGLREEAGGRGAEVSAQVARMLSEFETWYASNTGRLPPLLTSMPGAREEDWSRPGESTGAGGSSRGGGGGMRSPRMEVGGSREDLLDEGERFDAMEMAGVTQEEPDAGAYFSASRKLRHMMSTGNSLNARHLQQQCPSSPGRKFISPGRR